MKDIIELLQNERTKTVDALKQGEQDKLSHLQQLDKALGWLLLLSFNDRQRKWRSERLDRV